MTTANRPAGCLIRIWRRICRTCSDCYDDAGAIRLHLRTY